MGSLTPTIVMTALQTGSQLIQARSQARAQNAAAASAAQFQRQQVQQSQAIRERERRERLRRALASQRAEFGARGIGAGAGGSADAVLKGLSKDTERAIRDDRGRLDLSLGAIDRQLELRRRRNLLELSDLRRRSAFGVLQRGAGTLMSLLD